MAFLTPDEITSRLYGEVSDEISRGDDSILQEAIDAAQDEAASYLSAFDTAAIFATTGTARNNILLLFMKDIAVWHFIVLANPNVDMELRYNLYKDAIKWLEKVQSGKAVPVLPMPTVNPPCKPENFVRYGSMARKRNNYFN